MCCRVAFCSIVNNYNVRKNRHKMRIKMKMWGLIELSLDTLWEFQVAVNFIAEIENL